MTHGTDTLGRPPARLRTLVAAGLLAAVPAMPAPTLASALTTEERAKRGGEVISRLNNGQPQPTLERMREEFPFLAEATEAYALGDVWSRPGLDTRTRQLAAVAAFAAIGETAFMKIHAGYALNAGVSEDELKEIIYMVTVPAGFPRAITAARTLSELFAERRPSEGDTP
ncbi:carboxymuconolactone decarboxylase family protein [Azospirillum argentinense]|uniref:Carboxymuconolactone decarboxylase family protein n=1 Tax=Azospirillum argentinense TaxID=2970906 RepID=A0A4D8PLB8_9PROT|nr:carboxymuconolactone decarboxylase family protein [Azospirillum argentinense]QCN96498.1 carboxymuconolactone decarboxylase family protein [Azospirillum argentinense]